MTPQGERSDDVVERVARAINRSSCDSDEDEAFMWSSEHIRHNRMLEAIAAIAAMPQAGDAPDLEGSVANLSIEREVWFQDARAARQLLQEWLAVDGGSWHTIRYENEKADLFRRTKAYAQHDVSAALPDQPPAAEQKAGLERLRDALLPFADAWRNGLRLNGKHSAVQYISDEDFQRAMEAIDG